MRTWTNRIEAERKEAQDTAHRASDLDSIGWDHLADAHWQLVQACDMKVAALQRLKEVIENYDFRTAKGDSAFREQIKEYLRDQGLWPPKDR